MCRISGSGIRKAVLRPIRIMNDQGRYLSKNRLTAWKFKRLNFPESEVDQVFADI
jgi:hypothetical protein